MRDILIPTNTDTTFRLRRRQQLVQEKCWFNNSEYDTNLIECIALLVFKTELAGKPEPAMRSLAKCTHALLELKLKILDKQSQKNFQIFSSVCRLNMGAGSPWAVWRDELLAKRERIKSVYDFLKKPVPTVEPELIELIEQTVEGKAVRGWWREVVKRVMTRIHGQLD